MNELNSVTVTAIKSPLMPFFHCSVVVLARMLVSCARAALASGGGALLHETFGSVTSIATTATSRRLTKEIACIKSCVV